MNLVAQLAALLAILATGVVFGTDVFCALVVRPALARVDDASLTAVMGNVHRYGDRRMPVPGVLALLLSAAAAVLAVLAGNVAGAVAAGVAFVLLAAWTVVYARVSAPVNRVLAAAADRHETPTDARALQASWDRVIVPRATLQGLGVLALGLSLVLV